MPSPHLLEKQYELFLKKLNSLEKVMIHNTRDLEAIIKESLDSSFNLVKLVHADAERQSHRFADFQNKITLLEGSLEQKWKYYSDTVTIDNQKIIAEITNQLTDQRISYRELQKELADFLEKSGSQQRHFSELIKTSFDRNETSLDTVKINIQEQLAKVTAFSGKIEELEKNVDYRLRQFEELVRATMDEQSKSLKIVQDESYQLKKAQDIGLGKMEQLQETVSLALQNTEENIKLSFENHNAYISVLRNDIQRLQDPYKHLETRLDALATAVRSRNIWSLVSFAAVALVVFGVNFLFNQHTNTQFLKNQQAYQQLFTISQSSNEALLGAVKQSNDLFLGRAAKMQEKYLAAVGSINKKLLKSLKKENRKQQSALNDMNDRQLNLLESMLKGKR